MAGKTSSVHCITARACRSVIAALILCTSAAAQTLPLHEYTVDDGLPQSETLGAYQDSRGYLWIPTRNGLARFDGHSFTNYYRKDGLPSIEVTGITEDSNGVIWASSTVGMARFNGTKFHPYPAPDSLSLKQIRLGCSLPEPGKFILNSRGKEQREKMILFDNGRYTELEDIYSVLRDRKFEAMDSTYSEAKIFLSPIT